MSQEPKPIHVLLVEDNPDHAELIQRVLKRQASVASITAVSRGTECLEMLSQNSYSVLLLDYSLPGMDGLAVLKEIRRQGYVVPVVMVTSQGVERVAVEAMEEGASDYLIKAAGYLTILPTMLSKVLKQHELATENLRLLAETQARAQEQSALNAIATAVSQSLDVAELLQIALDKVLEVTGLERGFIRLKDPATGEIRLVAHRGVSEAYAELLLHRRIPGGKSDQVFESGKPLVVNDTEMLRLREETRREGNCAIAWFPLKARGKVLGILNVATSRSVPFSPREVELLEASGNVIGVALENARLFQETQRRARELSTLHTVNAAVSASLDLDQIVRKALDSVLDVTGMEAGHIRLLEGNPPQLVLKAHRGISKDFLERRGLEPRPGGRTEQVVATKRSLILENLPADPAGALPSESLSEGFTAAAWVPITSQEAVIGIVAVRTRSRQTFPREQIPLLESIGASLGVALANARLYEETERRRREAEELGRVSRTLTESLDVSAVGQRIVESVLPLFAAQAAVVWLVQPDGSMIVLAPTCPARDLLARGYVFPPGVGVPARAIAEGRPVWSSDVLSRDDILLPEDVRRHLADSGTSAVLAVPLPVKGKTIGVLAIRGRTGRAFSKDEVALLETFAAQGALVLENARLYEETRRRTQKLEVLAHLTRLMTAAKESQEVFDFITQSAVELLDAKLARLWVKDEEWPSEMVVRASSGAEKATEAEHTSHPRIAIGQGIIGRIAESRKPEFIPDVRQDPRWLNQKLAQALGLSSFAGIPLLLGEEVVGVLSVLMDHATPFGAEEKDLLKVFADQATIVIENARLFAEVRRSYEDLRQAQEHLVRVERLRALGEMAGGVAHDFNNLLAVILGRAQYLKMGLPDLGPEAVTRNLEIIEQSARDGAETVRHLFEFTRGAPALDLGPLNLNEVVTEVVAASEPLWKDEAEAKGITVAVEMALNASRPALGNASQLREALLNLIFNAVEAMPDGGRLSLTTWDEDNTVLLRVADEGIGMGEEVKKRAFEPFFTTKGPQRSGLGLSMVYGIISHHGGTITIENDQGKGKGTTVLVRLPCASASPPAPTKWSVPEVPPSRVLVIDDEEGIRETLADILEACGHTVVLAASGSEGLEWIERQPFDLICTDLGMPGMSGWQVIKAVKALRPDTPIALITGWGVQVREDELAAHQADFLLTKPFQISEVLTTLAEARVRRNGEGADGG